MGHHYMKKCVSSIAAIWAQAVGEPVAPRTHIPALRRQRRQFGAGHRLSDLFQFSDDFSSLMCHMESCNNTATVAIVSRLMAMIKDN